MLRQDKKDHVQFTVSRNDFPLLIESLVNNNYNVIAPTENNKAIGYDKIDSVDDLPRGMKDTQNPGNYNLTGLTTPFLFNANAGFNSWKQFLYPPEQKLWQAHKDNSRFEIIRETPDNPRLAFLGILPCDLNALSIYDKIFRDGPYKDPNYCRRRENLFIIASNCGRAGNNCFCTSMGSGPKAETGFDLVFTEILLAEEHLFVFETGSAAGRDFIATIPNHKATSTELETVNKAMANTARQISKTLDTSMLAANLNRNLEYHNWETIASRCLTCGNCTMVCPTCFCTNMEDSTDLTGSTAVRKRIWDSCFTLGFSYIAGGNIRASAKSRYRQWLTHKLANWEEQFGVSGCVGCGRCITWCPVGIDLTEEARQIANDGRL